MRLVSFRRRPLTALQVEVTSRCTRRCAICPRTPLADAWCDGDLADETWDRLRGDLALARHVHLQGWGEPLLHPRLREMVDAAKAADCSVGLTTNGDLLPEAVDWIVAQAVDTVSVSVAGNEKTHAALRDGSGLPEVLGAVEALTARRGRSKVPRVQVSYLLTRNNAEDLPGVTAAAARAGADELFVTQMDCTPAPELLGETAFDASGLRPGVAAALDAAAGEARSAGMPFRFPAIEPQELLVCALDPLKFVFVGWDGRVGPCVNLLLPVEGSIPRCVGDRQIEVEPLVFGHLADTRLREILSGERYRRFARGFEARLAAEHRMLEAVTEHRGAQALAALEAADRQREEELAAHPFPACCAGCHKVSGW